MADFFGELLKYCENEEDRRTAAEITRDAEKVCRMILDGGIEDIDIKIAEEKLRQKVIQLFPDKIELYRMIYESRFDRLRVQFRAGAGDSAKGDFIQ